jgi:hypothetical protein
MAYTPLNPAVFIAAYAGALSGMLTEGRHNTSSVPVDYADSCDVALAYAEEYDTNRGAAASSTMENELTQTLSKGVWAERNPNPTVNPGLLTPATHLIDCAAVLAMITESKTKWTAAGITTAPSAACSGCIQCRYVMTTDVPDLTAFTVLQDGVTGVAGDYVLLANQTLGAEAGVYKLGTVAAGVAPLTRVLELPTGSVVKDGYSVTVGEGTIFSNTVWFIGTDGSITIGTTAHIWFPEQVVRSGVLVAGSQSFTDVPILSATKSNASVECRVPDTATLTVKYQPTDNGADGITAGVVGGAAKVVANGCVADGLVNAQDVSEIRVTITNR